MQDFAKATALDAENCQNREVEPSEQKWDSD